jgi:hypothetical protein
MALTAASGAVYGRWTQRWGPAADLQAAGKHLSTFPRQLGDWISTEDAHVPEAIVKTLQCAGYVNRTYVNDKTKQSLGVALYVGPPGPISVHTPEICYSSRAMRIKDPPEQEMISAPEGGPNTINAFWKMTFQSRNVGSQEQTVYYAWSTGAAWEAAKAPRYEFGGGKILYKIQLAGVSGQATRGELADPCKDFLTWLLRSDWSLDEASR